MRARGRKMRPMANCYERELLTKPSLKGVVTISFRIDGSGSASSAKASGLANNKVHDCIARTVTSIKFPKPKISAPVKVEFSLVVAPGSPATTGD